MRGTCLEGVCDQMASEVVVGEREEKVAAREEKKGTKINGNNRVAATG